MTASTRRTATPGIYKRGNRYAVVVRDNNGRQIKRAAHTLAEAKALKATLTADIARGEHDTEERVLFEDYARTWIETFGGRSADGIREHSMVEYQRVMELHAIPFFAGKMLSDLRLPDIRRYAAHIATRGVSANTVRLYVGPVRVMLATAVEEGLLRSNPAADFRNVYGKRKRIDERTRALSDNELTRLIAELPEEYQLVVRFLAESGLRVGEATELRWHDFDFDKREVSVERRFYKDTVDAPKSRNGVRTIPIGEAMAAMLCELRADRDVHVACDDDLVFMTPYDTRMDVHNFRQRIYKPAAARAGVPWANIHMLRHTCASRLFRAGWSAKHVQQMLGHHSPAFTLATYVHLMPGDLNALPLPPVL